MNALLIITTATLYGAFGYSLGHKHRALRLALFLPMLFLGAYLLFALGLVMVHEFRVHFAYPVQFWGSVLLGEVLLSSAAMAAGWIITEGVLTKRNHYIRLGGVLICGAGLVYWQNFYTDYGALSDDTPRESFATQSSDYTCSATSLANLGKLYTLPISERRAAAQMRLSKFGGSVQQVAYALEQNGLSFTETEGAAITSLAFPAILIVDFQDLKDGHAILVLAREGDLYKVVDPLRGNITTRRESWFTDHWRGKGLQAISPIE